MKAAELRISVFEIRVSLVRALWGPFIECRNAQREASLAVFLKIATRVDCYHPEHFANSPAFYYIGTDRFPVSSVLPVAVLRLISGIALGLVYVKRRKRIAVKQTLTRTILGCDGRLVIVPAHQFPITNGTRDARSFVIPREVFAKRLAHPAEWRGALRSVSPPGYRRLCDHSIY